MMAIDPGKVTFFRRSLSACDTQRICFEGRKTRLSRNDNALYLKLFDIAEYRIDLLKSRSYND